jgi:signal transduction histidine kinase/ActR/RegA family two-component response regulator
VQSPEALAGKTDFDYYPEAEARPRYEDEQEIIRTGRPMIGKEEREEWKTGEVRWASSTKMPWFDNTGKIIGIIGISRDLTGHRKREEQFRQAQKMESFGQLAGGVAHDFNNILAIIQMQAGLLKAGGLPPAQAKFADEISATVERAAALTSQLLIFSRKQGLQPHDLDLNERANSMAKMLLRILGEHIGLQLNLAAQPLFVHADPGMMDQVLMNLAVNARDAMPKGGRLVIETSAVLLDESSIRAQSAPARPGPFVRLSVGDNGSGIPPEILPRIFEPFFTTKEVGKGTGLGLATVFGIVQQHHGWINVQSKVGSGTTVEIFLPRLSGVAAVNVAQIMPAHAPTGRETILLAEDEASLRCVIQMTLSQLGYRILEAASGLKALKIWQDHRAEISLLLTDLMMPDGMNGKELAQRLRQEDPGLKVLFMSGYSPEIAGPDFPMQAGVNFLAKPFQMQELAQIIRKCLDKTA